MRDGNLRRAAFVDTVPEFFICLLVIVIQIPAGEDEILRILVSAAKSILFAVIYLVAFDRSLFRLRLTHKRWHSMLERRD